MRKNLHISKNCITFAPKLKNKTGRQPETAAKKVMKTTSNKFEQKTGRLILGKTYFCIWGWRHARYIGTRKDEWGRMMSYFKDVCGCIVKCEASNVMANIDWDKTTEYNATH